MADFNFYLNRQGIKGRKGDTGEAGFSPIISVKTNTANEYVLNVQNESSSFDTPNLRGNAIINNGGTYIRYNPLTEEMYTGYADVASTSALGEVQFSTYAQLENGGVENLVPSSMDVYDFVTSQMQQIGITFDDLTNIMQAGSGISRAIDNVARTITFSADIDLSDVLRTSDISTSITSSSTDDEVASAKAVYNAIAAIPTPDLSNYVTLNTAQNITGLKTFYQRLDIVNNVDTVTHRLDYNGVNSYFRTPASDMIFIDRNRTLYLKDIVDSSTLATELASKQDSITDTITLQRTVGDNETTFTMGIEGNTGTLTISAQKENTVSGTITSIDVPSYYNVTATGATVTTTNVQDSVLGLGKQFAITVPQATAIAYGTVRPDNSTIKINGSGLLYADLSNYVTLNTAQTISGSKVFSSPLIVTDNVGLASGTSLSNERILQRTTTNEVKLGNTQNTVKILGSGTRPKYSQDDTTFSDIALVSDIPSVSNLANKDLSNLSSTGEKRLHALKGYLEEVEPLTDSEGYNDLAKGLHSTFDLSKFTVVGSPNITDDGIASGFSGSNFLISSTIPTPTMSLEIVARIHLSSTTTNENAIIGCSTTTKGVQFRIASGNKFKVVASNSSEGDVISLTQIPDTFVLNNNSDYTFKLIWDGTTYNFYYKENEQSFQLLFTKSSSTAITYNVTTDIGNRGNLSVPFVSGSIDLKQFSITVDGVEVFSGNKTGIDTIKSDDYTVEGTPTISDDGIVSNFSSTNSLTYDTGLDSTITDLEIYTQVQYIQNTQMTEHGVIMSPTLANGPFQINNRDGRVGIWNGMKWLQGSTYYNDGDIIDLKVTYKNSLVTIYSKLAGTEYWTQEQQYSRASNCFGGTLSIGRNTVPAAEFFYGKINLNATKLYVNGNLVWQPCLKIPYTFSIYGDRITDIQYLSRVQDAYNQTGNCDEAVIDTENQVYYLPAGNIYGKLNRLVSGLGDVSAALDAINGEEV